MRLTLKLLAPVVALLLATAPLHAQLMGPGWETNVTLTHADIDMIKSTLATQVHGKQQGAVGVWMNPASGNSGSITLLGISQRDGRRCEQIQYRMSPPDKTARFDLYVLTSCVQPDGTWKLS